MVLGVIPRDRICVTTRARLGFTQPGILMMMVDQ
jgi:hypothetical protein